MTDMKFKEDMKQWNDKQKGMIPAVLGGVYFLNKNPVGGDHVTYDNTVQINKETSKTITTQQTHTVGYEISLKVDGTVGLPFLFMANFEVTQKLSYSYANMKSDALTDTDKWGFSWRMASNYSGIAPQEAAYCKF